MIYQARKYGQRHSVYLATKKTRQATSGIAEENENKIA
jgi:hypothetical protein